MGCPFCYTDAEKTRIIAQRVFVYVALSNPRLVPGHMLVIPYRHVERLSELDAEERRELFDTAIEFQERVTKTFAAGADIRQQFMPFIAQDRLKVDHSHIHILPRNFKDELYEKCQVHQKEIFQDISKDEMDRYEGLFGDRPGNHISSMTSIPRR